MLTAGPPEAVDVLVWCVRERARVPCLTCAVLRGEGGALLGHGDSGARAAPKGIDFCRGVPFTGALLSTSPIDTDPHCDMHGAATDRVLPRH